MVLVPAVLGGHLVLGPWVRGDNIGGWGGGGGGGGGTTHYRGAHITDGYLTCISIVGERGYGIAIFLTASTPK